VFESLTFKHESNSQRVYEFSQSLMQKDKNDKKMKAQAKRDLLLKKSKFVPSAPKIIEEKGLQCGVCFEGYSSKPLELMGVYIFAKKIPLESDSKHPRSFGYSTNTQFNCIHLSCHNAAWQNAQKGQQKAKNEWEGASIRNGHSKLCNGIYPIKGGDVSLKDY
jgi:hypothetical protein